MREPDKFRTEAIDTKLKLLQDQPLGLGGELDGLLEDVYRDLQNVNNKVNELNKRLNRLESTKEHE